MTRNIYCTVIWRTMVALFHIKALYKLKTHSQTQHATAEIIDNHLVVSQTFMLDCCTISMKDYYFEPLNPCLPNYRINLIMERSESL